MTLYYIDERIRAFLADAADPDTGELPADAEFWESLDSLQMERETLIEQLGLGYKNALAEAKACRDEARTLTDRARRLEATCESIRGQLANALEGQKFSTGRVSFTFRKVTTAEITNEAAFLDYAEQGHEHLIRYKTPEVNKRELEAALKAGQTIPGAELQTRQSMSIK